MADLNALAAALVAARERKAGLEDSLKMSTSAVELADAALFEALVDAGLSKIGAEGYTFSPDVKDYYSVPAANFDAFHEVMEALGRGGIFKLTANAQTVNATLRELVAQTGEELPAELAGVVTVYQKQRCNVRKATVKG